MQSVLITGGAGFFGGLLKRALLDKGYRCVSVDLQRDDDTHPQLVSVQGDIRNRSIMRDLFDTHDVAAVFHCAAILAHDRAQRGMLWSTNVDGTRMIADEAAAHGVSRIVFISSNCLWGQGMHHPVTEDETPSPVDLYGRSKWEAERIVLQTPSLHPVIIRCPTIIDEGRLGLLAILFAFIEEGRKVWTVGGGTNRYQFIYGQDLVDACLRAMQSGVSGVFHIGSDDVPLLRESYEEVIRRAGTAARVASLPAGIAIPAMKAAHALGISPLGPYHYKMIAEDFVFDTTRIKARLQWQPTLSNTEMLWKAYEYYIAHRDEIASRSSASAHRLPAKMGVIRLLKWIS
ncbi:MAG TPA: NAD(P)-dependent oxidoreductase [Candidatus Peribacteraceae bacterium]|nr:NAD(P)-dependent oxidoreductase [Candidatus Peribacteraceae bacterium]